MRTRGRAAAVAAAVIMLLALPQVAPAATTPTTSTFTRIRITVTSSSDWTTVSLRGVAVVDKATVSVPAGGYIVFGNGGFAFRTPTPASGATAIVDDVLEVESTATPALRVDKGDLGSVQVTVDRTNATDTPIAALDTGPGRLSSAYVQTSIDRSALIGEGLSIPPVDPRHLVLAFYYPWFGSGSFNSGVYYDRPSGPYATDDQAALATMVDQARGAGIDGFIASWDGSTTSAARFDLLAQTVAARPDFTVSTYLELAELRQQAGRTDVRAIETAAAAALSRSAQSTYLKVNGRPVLFVYGTWTLQPDDWQAVMTDLASQGYHPFVVGDGSDPRFGFDGFHLYNPNNMDDAPLRAFDWASARRLRIPHVLHPDIPQQLWAATVSPGEDTVARKGVGTYRNRDAGLRYDRTWSAALASNPDWVLITTWNEWLETTEISPAQIAGRRALDQTTTWTARFHG